jgi:hypothetical protein
LKKLARKICVIEKMPPKIALLKKKAKKIATLRNTARKNAILQKTGSQIFMRLSSHVATGGEATVAKLHA